MVGFEKSLYLVNESAGLQEVCVTVTNPAMDQPLSLYIVVAYNTVMGSAGNIHSSYYTMHELVLFFRRVYTYASFLHDFYEFNYTTAQVSLVEIYIVWLIRSE